MYAAPGVNLYWKVAGGISCPAMGLARPPISASLVHTGADLCILHLPWLVLPTYSRSQIPTTASMFCDVRTHGVLFHSYATTHALPTLRAVAGLGYHNFFFFHSLGPLFLGNTFAECD